MSINNNMREELLEKVNGGALEHVSVPPYHVVMTSGMYKGLGGTVYTEIIGSGDKIIVVRLDEPRRSKEPDGSDPWIFEGEYIVG